MIGRLAFSVLVGAAAWGVAENARSARVRRALLAEWARHLDVAVNASGRWPL